MSGSRVCCKHCDSVNFIKKGTTTKKDGRIFLCKDCGKRFTYSFNDLRGTVYAAAAEETDNTPKVKSSDLKKAQSFGEKVTKDNSIKSSSNTGGFNMERAKRDKNGNLMLRIGVNGIPSPVGSSYEDLMSIVNTNRNCTLELGDDGIFVLKIATTTKGVMN